MTILVQRHVVRTTTKGGSRGHVIVRCPAIAIPSKRRLNQQRLAKLLSRQPMSQPMSQPMPFLFCESLVRHAPRNVLTTNFVHGQQMQFIACGKKSPERNTGPFLYPRSAQRKHAKESTKDASSCSPCTEPHYRRIFTPVKRFKGYKNERIHLAWRPQLPNFQTIKQLLALD